MENIIFNILLFTLFYGFLVWVTDGGNITFSDTKSEITKVSNPIPEKKAIATTSSKSKVKETSQKPIEQQVRAMLWDDENSPNNGSEFDESLIDGLSKLKLRKVAKALQITQTRTLTIDGKKQKKDKDKAWLIREIKQKIRKINISDNEIEEILTAATAA